MTLLPSRPDRWETPFSEKEISRLKIVHLFDDGDLVARVEWGQSSPECVWARFQFKAPVVYRVLCDHADIGESVAAFVGAGPTIRYTASSWLTDIRKATPNSDLIWPRLTHYIICTYDRRLEVICSDEPFLELLT